MSEHRLTLRKLMMRDDVRYFDRWGNLWSDRQLTFGNRGELDLGEIWRGDDE